MAGSVNIRQIGHAILHLAKYNEDYLVPVPDVKVKGVLSGSPYPELGGAYYITSSSGIYSKIDFTGKGLFSGKKNSFQASVFRQGDEDNALYEIEGQWTDSFTITDASGNKIETFDTNINDQTPLEVPDISDQDPWESRRAWKATIDALGQSNMQGTVDAKSKVEEAQRQLRRDEEQRGTQWQTLFFKREKSDSTFDALAKDIGAELNADRTVGVWKFDWDKHEATQRPFRGNLTPQG